MKKKTNSKDPKKVATTTSNSSNTNLHNCNYDLIQRMRFMNADQHITPEDSYTDGSMKFDD